MDNTHDEVLLRMKTMNSLLDIKFEEVKEGIDVLNSYCYTLRMYAEWMMGTVGPNSERYPEFAKLKDDFLTFEVLLTLDDKSITEYIISNLYLEVREFRRVVGKMIVELEELM